MKEIPGFPCYLADENGVIYTVKRKGGNGRAAGQRGEPMPLAVHRNRSGYCFVNLDVGGKNYSHSVHCLVLETFLGRCPEGMQGCHYPDSDKSNNTLSNLRWDTPQENARDRYRDAVSDGTKCCRRCKITKPESEFYHDNRASDGLHTECKSCHKLVSQSTRNRERCRERNKNWMRQYRLGHPK
mgnify:CR=1 FL=1